MLVIRFKRVGRKNDPAFRVVVGERRTKPQGAGVETLGSYHPKTKETALKNERILYWLAHGAKASPTVHNLLISKGVIQGTKISVVRPPKKAEEPAVSEVPVEGAASTAEKPVEVSVEEKPAAAEEKKVEPTTEKAGLTNL